MFWWIILIGGMFSLNYCAYILDRDYSKISHLKIACITGMMCLISGFIGASIVKLMEYGF